MKRTLILAATLFLINGAEVRVPQKVREKWREESVKALEEIRKRIIEKGFGVPQERNDDEFIKYLRERYPNASL